MRNGILNQKTVEEKIFNGFFVEVAGVEPASKMERQQNLRAKSVDGNEICSPTDRSNPLQSVFSRAIDLFAHLRHQPI